ncbi:MAG: hypothetical protein WCR06_01340 [bacterium]
MTMKAFADNYTTGDILLGWEWTSANEAVWLTRVKNRLVLKVGNRVSTVLPTANLVHCLADAIDPLSDVWTDDKSPATGKQSRRSLAARRERS